MTQNAPSNADSIKKAISADITLGTSRRARGMLSRIAITSLSLVMMVAILLGALLAILSRGPIELPFMSERVAVALEAQIGNGVDVDVGRSLLERTSNGLELHVQDIAIKDVNGKVILRAPDALLAFDPLRLLTFAFSPKRLELKGISTRINIAADGSMSFSTTGESSNASRDTSDQNNQTRLSNGLAALALLARQGTNGDLSAIQIQDATLLIDDQRVGRQLRFDQFSLVFENPQKGVAVAKGSLTKEGNIIPFSVEVKTVAENYTFSITTSNVNETLIASMLGLAELPMAPSGKLSGQALIVADPLGKILSAETTLVLRDGAVIMKGVGNKPFKIQEATIQAIWGGSLASIEKASLTLKGEEYSASLLGSVSLPTSNDPWIRFQGLGKDWTVSGLGNQDPTIHVKDVTMKLAIKDDGHQIILENMTLKGIETDISLNGNLSTSNEGRILTAHAALGAMPVRNAIRWWPAFLAPNVRDFFAQAVKSGTLNRLDLAMALPDWAMTGQHNGRTLLPDSLKLEASVDNVTAQIATGLPPLVGLAGTGRMNLRQADGTASLASIELRSTKRIPLTEGAFSITGLEGFSPKGVFRFRAQTPLENVNELLKFPALKDAFITGFNSESIKGQFDGRGSVTLPLGVTLKPKDIVTEFQGSMTSVSIDNAIGKDRLDNATLNISSDATGLEVKGRGLWQNIPVAIELENDSKDKSSSAILSFTLDAIGLKRLGINLGQSLIKPVPIRIKTLREDGSGLKANVEADLTSVEIDGLLPGYRKAAGRPGKLTFDAVEKAGGYSLQNFSLESGASSFKGTAEISGNIITSAKFSLYRLSPGDNVRLDYERSASGQKAVIRGNNFDARPFLKPETRSEPSRGTSAANGDLEIDLKTTLLSGFGGEVITNAEIKAVSRGDNLRQFNLAGRLNGKKVQIISEASDGSAIPLNISSDDAGAFLRYIDVYTRMFGGQLQGQVSGINRRIIGLLQANNFVLRNEPAMRRLVQGAPTQSVSGEPLKRGDASEARFTKMRVDFAVVGERTTIRDAVIFGPEIGLTFNGLIDNARDRISLSGTFVPAYGLNNALSQIPVLGNILTGSRNEGVLAVTFGVSGKASEPNVTINPLSAITPGIFRKIFEFRNDTTVISPAVP